MRFWMTLAFAAGLAGPAGADTLPEALASAYVNNPTLEAARAQARITDETWVQARNAFLPQLNLTGSYTAQDSDSTRPSTFPGLPASTTVNRDSSSAYGVQATQSIFAGGRRIAQLRQADAAIGQAQQGLRAVEQGVLLQTIAAYVDVRRDEEVVRIRANNVEVLTRQLQAARDRFEVGEITRTDVAQAEARLSAGEAGLAGARAQLEASRANYAQVVGASPGSLTPPPPAPALPEAFDVAVETALAANPDYLRLKAAERAAVQQVRIDQSSLLPSVSVVGRADRAFDQGIRGAESEGLSATAQVSVPLFDAGILRSRVRQSKTVLDRARSQTEETRRAVVANVSDAWNGHTAARRQVEASRKQESAAKLALEGAEQELQVGLRTTLDVLNAQQEFLEAQLAVVSAERNAYVAAHALLQSVGALDAQTLGVNAPLYDPNEHKRAARRAILANDPSGKP